MTTTAMTAIEIIVTTIVISAFEFVEVDVVVAMTVVSADCTPSPAAVTALTL